MARADARRRGGRRWASDGRVTIVARLAFALASALALAASRLGVDAGCEYYTNCGACVADASCGWCGNDPYSTGGYGNTNHGDHNGVVGPDGYGEGMITVDSSGVVTGINTRFTKMFHSGGVQRIKSATGGSAVVTRVTSDTSMTVSGMTAFSTAENFTLDMHVTPTGTLALAATVTALPESGSTQNVTITGSSTEFTKELKVGYWLILYGTAPATPEVRVITSITSDTSLTVDYDLTGVTWTTWGYVSCPPRIGKRGVGMGTIQNHKEDQSATFQGVAANAASTKIADASGAATGKTVRIGGQGTRFASQLGASTTWNTYSYTSGPWMSVQINGDWETVQVKDIGTDDTTDTSKVYSEYVAELHNSFSEPLLKATHWEYYTMLTKGYGKVRSYGKRVVSNAWGNKEGFHDAYNTPPTLTAGSISSTGAYGDTRFLTQLRTGYTITACGQTRMVNSIQSDVELTIDRPFTLGNIEYIPATSTDNRANLHVRGLTRLLPLWPRGVTVNITAVTTGTFNYTTYWKTFANAAATNTNTASTSWLEIQDSGVGSGIGVYIKWASITPLNANDEFRLHVADIENCQYHISTEGERFMTDDNLNPPICYNHGRCIPATSTSDSSRPSKQLTGTSNGIASGTLTGVASKFLSELTTGDIIVEGTNEYRVVSITSDTVAVLDASGATLSSTTTMVSVKRCAGGREGGATHSSGSIVDDTTREAYTHHPKHTYYQTYSHLYCEVDPGCCGFRLSSVVDPERYAYYFVKPDHSDYDFRIAVHTVNDNLDLYTKIGTTRPTTAAYDSTSVRESVPWAIDIDASTMACSGNLAKSVLGGATAVATAADAYNSALGKFIHADNSPACSQVTVGIMGDNRYPQTVGASEYTARVYMEFNFANFECADSAESNNTYGANFSYLPKCVQHNLRFAGDAKPVLSNTAYYDGKTHTSTPITQEYVIRLTESYARISSSVSNVWKASTDFRTSQRSGAVWWHRKVHIWDGFETNFEFRITNPTQCGGADTICDGADGFAFVISNDDRQEAVTSFHGNEGWACTAADNTNTVSGSVAYTLCAATTAGGGGMIGCPGDGLGYGESTMADSASFNAVPSYCDAGLKKSLAVEFDTFYNVERRDPKQGKEHWWINATEYVSYNDNHLGVFMTTDTSYASQPWGSDKTRLTADHSDDDEGAHYGSTPSVPTMADNLKHTVKIRYTRGFTTEKAGSGLIATNQRTVTGSTDGNTLKSTAFKTELRTGFEFGYGGRVKANAKIKLNLDKTDIANADTSAIAGLGFGIDSMAVRVLTITSDTAVTLMGDTTDEPAEFLKMHDSAFPTDVDTLTSAPLPSTATPQSYNIIKEFPGEIQVFIDDMDRYVFQVAVEDRDMAKILDHDGNAYIGLTASTGSKGFAKVGYTPASVHQTTDIYSWNYCSSPGCVAY
mmetsp:Transcript_9004/g.30374  ORF Transcript_9004/g.30374 Transcript_9004/m.30374 type:complete len:1423 (-) Transcript_9004:79-4347(-)